jgi:hypothetical protein
MYAQIVPANGACELIHRRQLRAWSSMNDKTKPQWPVNQALQLLEDVYNVSNTTLLLDVWTCEGTPEEARVILATRPPARLSYWRRC